MSRNLHYKIWYNKIIITKKAGDTNAYHIYIKYFTELLHKTIIGT